ncbi:choloylglycine hydrolase family protein [Vagococcus vulneris]|uniref:Linear amide C-N hydrolase n=1 Tax=Vagococcus vulneris TaxID=1977869 RepID=A0A429ZSV0_9ENTE|nr:choloylglycine hydrolase family protein [Vagococcus vulneris]RST96741.1 linear amide C-N hydrolase [Vagococcus vulneris]
MCTSIFIKTKDGNNLLSRTMDYSLPLDPNPTYIPRHYPWKSVVDGRKIDNKYGYLGAGRVVGPLYTVADAVNEKGLSMAELYLPGEVRYQEHPDSNKTNLAPHEFILYILGNCASVKEVKEVISDITIVDRPAPILNFAPPLHWIITDASGECGVIEPTSKTLHMKKNPVGVMTNTPQLEWHINNLRNYVHVRPKQYEPVMFGDYEAKAFSQGTGTLGLPGGFTPPERFVRAAFFKEHIKEAENEVQGVSNAYHILSTVRIPKGLVVTPEGKSDYSQYVGTMCNTSLTYYYSGYDNNQICKVQITEKLLKEKEPVTFMADPFETMKTFNY